MKVNCGFYRKKPNGRPQHHNECNIEVDDSLARDHTRLRQELMRHKPDGPGWYITGFYIRGKE